MKKRYINSLRDQSLTELIQRRQEEGLVVVNAPRPLPGEQQWEGDFITGIHYATGRLEDYSNKWERLGAAQLCLITNAEILQKVIESCQSHPFRYGLRSLLEKRGKSAVQEMAANLEMHYMIDESSDLTAELEAADWSVLGREQ